jgi:hypothetical protein
MKALKLIILPPIHYQQLALPTKAAASLLPHTVPGMILGMLSLPQESGGMTHQLESSASTTHRVTWVALLP